MISWLKRIFTHRWLWRLITVIFGLMVIAVLIFIYFAESSKNKMPSQEIVDKYVYLNQGWGNSASDDARQTYYYTPQGTSMPQGAGNQALRYNWFVNLEQPLSEQLFTSPDFLRRFRFLVDDQATAANPDQLPVGFTRHFNEQLGEYVLDISCAACHNGELHYEKDGVNYAMRVDGGQAMHAFTDLARGTFGPTLISSLLETWLNPVKFNRFADRVLKDSPDASRSTLHSELGQTTKAFLSIKQNNPLRHLYPTREGYGRTDALGRIANTLFGDHLVASNLQESAAPVSYPFLWNIWKFNWVQYNGSVAQPLARNIGEALGVGANINLITEDGEAVPAEQRFNSSVRIADLEKIENNLQHLLPPQWPSDILGDIDQQLAGEGKALFENHCKECHGPHQATQARQLAEAPLKQSVQDQWLIEVIELDHIGTDGNAARGFIEKTYDLSATGIDKKTIYEVLNPLLQRQLARDTLARLRYLTASEKLEPDAHLAFANLVEEYPEPDALADSDFKFSPFTRIQETLTQHELLPTKKLSADYKAYRQLGCNFNCQVNALWWNTQFSREHIAKELDSFDPNALTEGIALNVIGLLIKNRYYKENNLSDEQQQCLEGFGTLDLPQQILGYKPRPLAGVWATPPFLHNGSVPNIYQMLMPPEQRDSRFFVGRRDYDPIHLGYVSTPATANENDGMWFDTSLSGNHNSGHAFAASAEQWSAYKADYKANPLPHGVIGPLLEHQQRMALIEYLKIHRDNEPDYKHQGTANCHPDNQG